MILVGACVGRCVRVWVGVCVGVILVGVCDVCVLLVCL